MIAGNKTVLQKTPVELYSERVKTIRWFEQQTPQDFGLGWNMPAVLPGRAAWLMRTMRRYIPHNGGKNYFPSYRGQIVSKRKTMQGYRFAICYENVRDLPGYITEKNI